MQFILAIVIGVISFFVDKDATYSSLYHIQFVVGIGVLTLALVPYFEEKFGSLIGISYMYYAAHTLLRMSFPKYFFPYVAQVSFPDMQSILSDGFMLVTLMMLFFAKYKIRLKELFMGLCAVDSVMILIRIMQHKQPFFLFNNPAIDAAFISVCVPMFLEKRKYLPLLVLSIGACLLTITSTSILGLGVGMFCYFFIGVKSIRIRVISLFIPLFFALLGMKMQGKVLLNGSGRYEVWKMSIRFFEEKSPIFGIGSGTFDLLGPAIQKLNIDPTVQEFPGFFWMHNDWLQVMFELGYLGFILILAIFLKALWNTRKNAELFACLATYGAIATTQMPLRWFIFSLLGGYLLTASIQKKQQT